MLAEEFVKLHSKNNTSEEMEINRQCLRKEDPNIMVGKRTSSESPDVEFLLYELKRVIGGVKQTSPGKDEICYTMIKNVSN